MCKEDLSNHLFNDDFFIDVEFYGNGDLYGSDFGEVIYRDDENNIEFSWEFNVIEIMED